MFHSTPAAARVTTDTRTRARSIRFSRVAHLAATPRSTSLSETLSVGLGLTQR